MYKLPVWETIGTCFRFVWAERRAWFDYVLIPVVAISVIPLLLMWALLGTFQLPLGPSGLPDMQNSGGAILGAMFLIWLLIVVIYASFAVAWHRRFLLGPDRTSPRELFTWQRRHWAFVWRGVLITLMAIAIGFAIGFVVSILLGIVGGILHAGGNTSAGIFLGGISWFAMMLLIFALMVGPMLVFPATAIEDEEFTIGSGWRIASDNRWRMVGIYLFGVFIPVFIVQFLLLLALGGGIMAMDPNAADTVHDSFSFGLVLNLISNAVYFLGVAIGVSMLSIMYRRLRDNVPSNESASA